EHPQGCFWRDQIHRSEAASKCPYVYDEKSLPGAHSRSVTHRIVGQSRSIGKGSSGPRRSYSGFLCGLCASAVNVFSVSSRLSQCLPAILLGGPSVFHLLHYAVFKSQIPNPPKLPAPAIAMSTQSRNVRFFAR